MWLENVIRRLVIFFKKNQASETFSAITSFPLLIINLNVGLIISVFKTFNIFVSRAELQVK